MKFESYQQLWQNQATLETWKPPIKDPLKIPGSVKQQLHYFDKEQSPNRALGGILSSLGIAIALACVANEHKMLWFVAGLGLLSSLFQTYMYMVLKQNRAVPDEDLHTYLQKSLKKVSLHARGIQLAGIGGGGLMGGMIFHLVMEYQSGELTGKEFGGLLAMMMIFGGIAAMLLWWYREQHPYRSPELRRNLTEILDDYGSLV